MNIWQQEINRLTARIKELEAEISNLDAELDHWSQLAVDDIGRNPPTSWKEIAEALRAERDELDRSFTIEWTRAREFLNRAEAAEKELERIKAINVKHCETVNTLLIDGSRWQDRAEAAEAKVKELEQHCIGWKERTEEAEAAFNAASSNREGGEE